VKYITEYPCYTTKRGVLICLQTRRHLSWSPRETTLGVSGEARRMGGRCGKREAASRVATTMNVHVRNTGYAPLVMHCDWT